jgi:predicted nuclease of predicted toxin-antitoxin system
MRFLVDKNVSFRICAPLIAAGHDAVHVDEVGLGSAPDLDVLLLAASEERVVVSADTDFGTLLAASRATTPSVILTREISTMASSELAALLLANLAAIEGALTQGAVVAFGTRTVRIRNLPLR